MIYIIYLYIIGSFVFIIYHRDELIHSWFNMDDIIKMILIGLMWLPSVLIQSFYKIRRFIRKQFKQK